MALPKKRCLELSRPNKRWNLERLKVPDTFFWAKPAKTGKPALLAWPARSQDLLILHFDKLFEVLGHLAFSGVATMNQETVAQLQLLAPGQAHQIFSPFHGRES